MNCKSDIIDLAWLKFKAANNLLENGFADDAYYLGGYTVELLLKAMVCKTLKIDDFFAFKIAKKELYKPYKVHNYEELLILSGLYHDFEVKLSHLAFKEHWSIISTWGEDSRYLTGRTPEEVKDFLTSVDEFGQWIQKHL